MRTAVLAALIAGALAASARADVTDKAPPPKAFPPDLAVFGPPGLQVGTTPLYAGQVDGAAYDPSEDLIWFVSAKQLFVIDLRDAHPTAIAIVKNVPEGLGAFAVDGWSKASFQADYTPVYLVLDLTKKPKLAAGTGAYAGIDEESDKQTTRAVKKAKLVGAKWLAAQKGRAPHAIPPAREKPANVTLPPGAGQCEDETMCGDASWLGGSPYQVVLTEHSCGDACHTGCVLYDPKSKKFASALADGAWGALDDKTEKMSCIGYDAEPSGAHYFGDGNKVCTLGAGKMACVDLEPLTPFAWILPAQAAAPAKP